MCAIYHLQNPPIAWILFILSITAVATLLFVTLKLKSSNKQDEKKVTLKLKSSNKKKKRQGRRGGSHNQPTPPAPTAQTSGSHNQTTLALTSESEYGATSHLPPEESESDTPSDIPPLENVSDTDVDHDDSASDTHLLSSKQLILNGVKDQYFANIRKGKITGASVIEYQIACSQSEGNNNAFDTPRQVTVFFEDGKAVESTLVPYSTKLKKMATRHFQNSSGLAHQNLLIPKCITFDEEQKQWYIFYDKFCCTYNQWTDRNNCTNLWWRMFVNYDRFVSMLIDHPTLKSEFSKLKCYFDFHQSKKHKTRMNGPRFATKIKGPDFEEFRNWDTKIVIHGYLDKSKKFTEKEKGEKFNGNCVEDLIRLIRNVYVHYVKDGEFDKINKEISTCFPGLLSCIHANLRIKKEEEVL
ncbi:hypothetical protein C1H46_043792 [Malus baccata]|uniref:KEN domain-containing protein n=1 Tax=Malus baccata TaxID=106549 RepID=A0A540K9Q4_MALBA|nr:hypothetical protein C1H46_043792 [Malus baccata]